MKKEFSLAVSNELSTSISMAQKIPDGDGISNQDRASDDKRPIHCL